MDRLTPDQVVQILERGTTIPGDGWDSEQIGEALTIAAREVGKQIPKRVVVQDWNPNLCPTCSADLGGECNDGFYENPWFERCPECGQKLNYDDAKEIERISFRFRSLDGKIFDNIEAAVKHFMCPGPCSLFCPLHGNSKTVLPNGHNCKMCEQDYYKLHPLLVAEAMGYEIIPSDQEST